MMNLISRTAKSLAILLLFSCVGCCNPRGYLLHGDWSLELNRVPWRNCGGDCAEGCGAMGCGSAMPMEGPAMPEGPPPATHAMSRFHTVPSKPAFAPVPASTSGYMDVDGEYTHGGTIDEDGPTLATNGTNTPRNAKVTYSNKRRGDMVRQSNQASNSSSWVFNKVR